MGSCCYHDAIARWLCDSEVSHRSTIARGIRSRTQNRQRTFVVIQTLAYCVTEAVWKTVRRAAAELDALNSLKPG
jgi:hypothetical protein